MMSEVKANIGVVVPDSLLFDKELSANEFRILLVLRRMSIDVVDSDDNVTKTGNIILDVTRQELAEAVKVSIPTVYTCLLALQKAGYIRVMPQKSQGKGKFSNSPIVLVGKKFD